MTVRSDVTLADRIHDCILDLLSARGPGRSICPSEVARMMSVRIDHPWHDLMRPVRTVAASLAASGILEALQDGALVNIREVRGPISLRLRVVAKRAARAG